MTVVEPPPERRRDPWRTWYPAAIVTIVAVATFLIWWGSGAILGTTSGTEVRTITDPAQPGFEALVDPTPVMAVLDTDPDGGLDNVVVLSLVGQREGGVIVVPPSVLADPDGGRDLDAIWRDEGRDATIRGVEQILNVAIGENRIVEAGQWEQLVEPVGPLTVGNPDTVSGPAPTGSGTVSFPAGELSLEASQVASYLAASAPNESELNRMVRVQQFWAAWISAVGERVSEQGVVPGEADTGLGRFVRSLAVSEVELATVPVAPGSNGTTEVVVDATGTLVARLIPYPVGPTPESRLRTRILDGTGQLGNGRPAVQTFVAAGAEIATLGNATNFDYRTTQFIVASPEDRVRAEALRDALGVGEVVDSAERASAVDVTVILGTDAVGTLSGPVSGG